MFPYCERPVQRFTSASRSFGQCGWFSKLNSRNPPVISMSRKLDRKGSMAFEGHSFLFRLPSRQPSILDSRGFTNQQKLLLLGKYRMKRRRVEHHYRLRVLKGKSYVRFCSASR